MRKGVILLNGGRNLLLDTEKTNMVPEALLKQKYIVSPLLKGLIKGGGAGLIATCFDIAEINRKYSGIDWWLAQSTNSMPIIVGVAGGAIGGDILGVPGVAIGGVLGGVLGESIRWKILSGLGTDRQKEIDDIIRNIRAEKKWLICCPFRQEN